MDSVLRSAKDRLDMDCWLPSTPDTEPVFRTASKPRVIFDVGAPSARRWRFCLRDAYLPRKTIWPGDDIAVRLLLGNDSEQEGTAYYVVTLRDPFRSNRIICTTDVSPRRQANLVSVDTHDQSCVQVLIPWTEIEPYLATVQGDVLTVSVEIEIWVPRRVRMADTSFEDWLIRHLHTGRFQRVALFANLTVMARAPTGSCFISYAWNGSRQLASHDHRVWIYGLADMLGRANLRAEVDYNFLTPAAINKRVIDRHLASSDHILIIYSDAYLERLSLQGSGVQFEYERMRSQPALWAKSYPVRKHVLEQERRLYELEQRYVLSFETGDLATNVNTLVRHMA
jgi:hypothetical protein